MKKRFIYKRKNLKFKINNNFLKNMNSCDFVNVTDDSKRHIYKITTSEAYYWNRNTIEAGRKVISRLLRSEKKKNNPKCLTYVKHFGLPLTTKKKGRMGKGKGKITTHVSLINENSSIYLISNISRLSMLKIMSQLQKKMPIKLNWYNEW
jgi:ribosomal protein L16/L10AE